MDRDSVNAKIDVNKFHFPIKTGLHFSRAKGRGKFKEFIMEVHTPDTLPYFIVRTDMSGICEFYKFEKVDDALALYNEIEITNPDWVENWEEKVDEVLTYIGAPYIKTVNETRNVL